jgi:subtilase family serine protease
MRKIARIALGLVALIMVGGSGSSQVTSKDRILRTIDPAEVATVRATAHPLARREFDQGRKDPGEMIRGSITFRLSAAQQADLDKLLRQQQDRTSANYHRWLTPEQYAARFGMSSSDLAKVSAWLQSQGVSVEEIARNHNEISFSGSAGQVEYAFKTELHNYGLGGVQHFANATDVSLPAAFSAQVLGVRGLDDFRPQARVHRFSPRFTSNLSGNHFLIPGDFWTIYNVPHSTYTGAGQKIAVVGQTDINNADIDAFRIASGLATNDPTKILVPNTGALVVSSGDEGEADLDIEWAGGIATAAAIVYVTVGNNPSFSVFDALHYAVQNNVAPAISISYGNCESNMSLSTTLMFQQWAQQANAQGQTISGPSGDSGAADCDLRVSTNGYQVDVPASIPEVTGVGGSEFTGDSGACPGGTCSGNVAPANSPYWSGSSSLTSGASALIYIPEMGWNDSVAGTLSASGGGASAFFGKPSWQTGTGIPADGKRDVPDIALNASNAHDPYLICSGGDCVNGFRDASNNLDAVGGTSAGAPAFAAVVALINQATSANGLGNVNPMLYSLAASSPTAFHDITAGNNIVPCTSGTTNCPAGTTSIGFSAGTGYDQVTGLGSLDVQKLITAWLGASPGPDFSLVALTSTISAPGGTGSSTVTVTSIQGFTGTVNLACTGISGTAQVGCSVNPPSVNVAANSPPPAASVTITTVADLRAPRFLHRRPAGLVPGAGLLATVILGGIPLRRRWLAVLGLVLGVGILAGVACGGGSGSTPPKSQGTPPGTYVLTVTGTSGSTTHNATISLTVQ